MKRITSLLLALALILPLTVLSSCKKDDAPDGMQLIMGGDDIGYYFYGPEEWTRANVGDIACTYVSKMDNSSMTFALGDKGDESISEYFAKERLKFPYEIDLSVEGEECIFGDSATKGYKYIYSFSYKNIDYRTMQIFVEANGEFYIFTYNASTAEKSEGVSYYDAHLEKATRAIECFRLVTPTGRTDEAHEYERDEDGYILVSDKTLAGFKLYVPESFTPDISEVLVSASHSDGSNITMSKATYTGVSADGYWSTRRENLERIVDKTVDSSGNEISTLKEIRLAEEVELDSVNWAFGYEYTYTLLGKDYHVYQVLIVEGAVNGYVFTYTAEETVYENHLDEAISSLRKTDF